VPLPTPKADQVLVRVHAASINDWDWEMLRGQSLAVRMLHALLNPRVRIIGCDIAGRVAAVGEGVKAFRVGDEVYGDLCMCGFGAFAEYACALATCLARKPAAMTFEQAAAIPQAGMLAVQGLIDVGRIQRRQKVLLNGAGGASAPSLCKLLRISMTQR
jgi:NADPH:quinone reductase-like Zn-dependent oxidoreductase